MARKRRQYRVRPDNLFLRAELQLEDGTVYEGYVLDLSGGGAGVLLAAGDNPVAIGTEVEVLLDSYKLPRPLRLRGQVRLWAKVDEAVRCGIEFEDAGALDRQVPDNLREEFNRRRFPRHVLPEPIRIELRRKAGGEACFGEIADLSAGGLRVLLPLAQARAVDEWQRLWVTFRLPGAKRAMHLPVTVANRYGMRVGLEFDAGRADDLGRVRAELQAFVAEREAERRLKG